MANLGIPPEAPDLEPIEDDMYEAFTSEVEETPNRFYDPETSNPLDKTQLQWTVVIREGENKGRKLRYWTGANVGRSSLNKLTNLVKVIDPEFDINVSYNNDWDLFRSRVLNRPLRVVVKATPGKEDPTKIFSKITGVLKSKMGDVSVAEAMAAVFKEIPESGF